MATEEKTTTTGTTAGAAIVLVERLEDLASQMKREFRGYTDRNAVGQDTLKIGSWLAELHDLEGRIADIFQVPKPAGQGNGYSS